MSFLVVEEPGLLTTTQDLGRFGHAHEGISASGVADDVAARVANRLVGNTDRAPLLELTLIGGRFAFHGPAVIAVTGASMPLQVDGRTIPRWRAVSVAAGERLLVGAAPRGARAYLAVRGGLDVTPVLGSAATHLMSGIGGFGRAVRAGDMIGFGLVECDRGPVLDPVPAGLDEMVIDWSTDRPLRLTPGPELDWFPGEATAALTNTPWQVHEHSDRMGIRLAGPPLERVRNEELLTVGVSLGTLQIMPDGQPVLLFVDHQTTGGYPRIATLATVDRHRAGQLRPRDRVRFEWIGFEEARRRLREREAGLDAVLPAWRGSLG